MSLDVNDKTKWVNALRSGEYQQGKGVLHNPDTNTYCCLGVLCEVTDREFRAVNPDDYDYTSNDMEENSEVYGEFRELFGSYDIPREAYAYEPDNIMDRLMHWNDNTDLDRHKDFNQIADWVEANL
jgi:hypothetical protein